MYQQLTTAVLVAPRILPKTQNTAEADRNAISFTGIWK